MLFIYLTYLKIKNERQEELTESMGTIFSEWTWLLPVESQSPGDLLMYMAGIGASFLGWDKAGTSTFSGDLTGTSTSSAVAVDTAASSWDEAGTGAFV